MGSKPVSLGIRNRPPTMYPPAYHSSDPVLDAPDGNDLPVTMLDACHESPFLGTPVYLSTPTPSSHNAAIQPSYQSANRHHDPALSTLAAPSPNAAVTLPFAHPATPYYLTATPLHCIAGHASYQHASDSTLFTTAYPSHNVAVPSSYDLPATAPSGLSYLPATSPHCTAGHTSYQPTNDSNINPTLSVPLNPLAMPSHDAVVPAPYASQAATLTAPSYDFAASSHVPGTHPPCLISYHGPTTTAPPRSSDAPVFTRCQAPAPQVTLTQSPLVQPGVLNQFSPPPTATATARPAKTARGSADRLCIVPKPTSLHDGRLRCPVGGCERIYRGYSEYSRHYKEKHAGMPRFCCHCGQEFDRKYQLHHHCLQHGH